MIGSNVGKYQILDRIGRGGMGTVYRAMDETLHREVAVKVLNAELNDPEVARRFRAEAVTVARLNHPGIATIFELFEYQGQWLMVMEFVRGETLEKLVERMGPLSPQRAAELCMQVLTALAHAHSLGVIHRDLKPANLMITDTGAIKIMDFGIARVTGTEHLTNAGFMMGTPAYMAPEQVLGHEIDARADLYSMGVVFYRLTTGKLPFKGETPFAMAQSQVNDPPTPLGIQRSDLPPWADQITIRALSKALEERFQSAVEFYEAFSRCLAGLPMTTLYNPSAPTELLATPARAMPTGTFTPRSSPVIGTITNMGQIAGRATVQTPADGTGASGPYAATQMAPTTAPLPQPTGTAQTAQPPRRTNVALIALGVLLVLGAIGLAWWIRTRGLAPPAVAETPPATTQPTPAGTPPDTPPPAGAAPPAAGQTAAAGSDPARGEAGRGVVPPPVPGATTTPGRGDAIPPAGRGTQPPGTTGAPGTAVPTGTEVRPPATAAADEHVMFSNVKLLKITGKKAQDQDAVITFGGGQISVTAKNGGAAIASVPYKGILKATYVHAKTPGFDSSLAMLPPEGLELPGGLFGKPTRHWLTLQTKTLYSILRLDDSNFAKILETLEGRTSLKVDRPITEK
jgi:protein kinase-like protein